MSNRHACPMAPNEDERRNHLFITVNRSAMHQYRLSFQTLSNTSSTVLLDEILKEHEARVDDLSPNGVDNFCGPITQLIPNKHMVHNSKNWHSSLRTFSDSIDLEKIAVAECANVPSCGSKNINLKHLNIFLNNNHETPSDLLSPLILENPKTVETNNIPPVTPADHKRKLFVPPTSMTRENKLLRPFESSKPFAHQSSSQGQSDFKHQNNRNAWDKPLNNKPNTSYENIDPAPKKSAFKTAREQLISCNPTAKRSLGTARKAPSKFVSPMMSEKQEETEQPEVTDDRLKHIDPKMVELIQSEIIDNGARIGWDDIAGLQTAKSVIQEAVVWPLLRPDIFTGLRRPPKGVLLFGPPGTGKTLIGKCVASQCHATFFNISASSLTSKWIGDGEKMVRALFAVARTCQPAVVFVDEIDSLLTQRNDAEHEATRRIKTEFLVQFDGAGTGEDDLILIIGATNRPQELDEAARRRLVKRLYIPLPDYDSRKQMVTNLMRTERHSLNAGDVEEVSSLSDGYSGADMRSLCSEAAMGPIRSLPMSQMINVHTDQVRPVSIDDFHSALQRVRPSVSQDDLQQYVKWNNTYGFGSYKNSQMRSRSTRKKLHK